ncbi:lytic transglycosylase domain-containing protein [Candidatus Manganitrophus noduliformans]|uniref:Lytic transglycosylase domain-containing protein n=1 Tax=Candidatus Manganitrophus noduliformans TaxID=2606439 RepID=A0A7X6DT34_9BACT|nr:lytic transglycosylase domain-containing protein [Candidatus Manganitrophus noduliformans]NKE72854.1 lytic transglycosylase domain-containing protein [Candidatus Manganitrophus noduliformans]
MPLVFIFAGFLLSTPARSAAQDPFTDASRVTGIPVQLLVAISRVESSHHPWALNLNGEAVYPSSREEAEEILKAAPDNVDIGLMQINYRIWGRRLGLTKVQLLDDHINIWAGAAILRFYFSQYPFWEAVGRYHSGDRSRRIWYAWRVYRALFTAGNPH